VAGNYTTLDAREFSSTLAAVLILFLPSSSDKTLFSSYINLVFLLLFFFLHGRMSVRVSPLTLMIPFPLYYLNFLPTVSVSSKQRRPDLDLCLFIPKSPFASNSDPNTTILFFFSLHILLFHTVPFFIFFHPLLPLNLIFFSSVAFHLLTGIRFLFSLLVCFWTGFCLYQLYFSLVYLYSLSFIFFIFFS